MALKYIYVKNSRLGPDLSTSENDRVISPFREGFIYGKFAPVKFREKFRIYSETSFFSRRGSPKVRLISIGIFVRICYLKDFKTVFYLPNSHILP